MIKVMMLLLLSILFLSASCGNSATEDSTEDAVVTANATATGSKSTMWQVELISVEVSDSLLTSIAAVQYSGETITTENLVEPAQGNVFLLLELSIEKTGSGRASFTWRDARITDAGGGEYFRHPNDTFLAHLNIPRLKGTDIVFGLEYGFACFEIPASATGLRFVADDGNIVIELDI